MVYVCLYSSYESVVSRHYVSSISTCKKAGELPDAENVLPKNLITVSRTRDEFLITDTETIQVILLKLNISNRELEDYLKERGLYLVIRQEG